MHLQTIPESVCETDAKQFLPSGKDAAKQGLVRQPGQQLAPFNRSCSGQSLLQIRKM
jgi:hypothetical protein